LKSARSGASIAAVYRALGLLLLGLSACATEGRDDLLSRRGDREPLRPVVPAPPPPPGSEDKIPEHPVATATPEERAATMPNDQACVRAHTEQDKGGDPSGAFQLLRACAAVGKWRDLRRALSPPINQHLAKLSEPEALTLLYRIIANRGGIFESDVPLTQRWSWGLHYLAEGFGDDPLPKDAWVVFRTDAAEAKRGKNALTLVELVRSAKDSKASFSESGRVIIAKNPGALLIPEEGELIVLARLEKVVANNRDGYPEARVSLVEVMRPGLIAPDLTQ
jgi:hypothetical protein